MVQITIRDVDEKSFKKFKAFSAEMGMKLGVAITLAMGNLTSSFESRLGLAELKTFKGGKGTERVSENVDKILYGE